MTKDDEITNPPTEHYQSSNNRFGFRCNYHFADNTCYGGPDGGSCPSGRRRRRREILPETEKSLEKVNKVEKEFSLAFSGKCGRGWRSIRSLKKCKEAAHKLKLSLSFQLERDNTSSVRGCFATEENSTIVKAICQSETNRRRETTPKVEVKRRKRSAGPEIFFFFFLFLLFFRSGDLHHEELHLLRLGWWRLLGLATCGAVNLYK